MSRSQLCRHHDWHLMRECPATLMLVGNRKWHAPPTFAALVDVSGYEAARIADIVLNTSEHFSLACGAELDVVYSNSGIDCRGRSDRLENLQRLTHEHHIAASHVHVLEGEPWAAWRQQPSSFPF